MRRDVEEKLVGCDILEQRLDLDVRLDELPCVRAQLDGECVDELAREGPVLRQHAGAQRADAFNSRERDEDWRK